MKTIKPQEDKYIYTDEVDYSKTPNASVWGTEEETTVKILNETEIFGKWLNLCAGDGRFNNRLLERVDKLIATDIDKNALQKLIRITPQQLRTKLKIKVVNAVEAFPFENESFDGIFCVGTLHLFPKEIFKKMFSEIDRVLKKDGKIIIDFATDIERTYPDGSLWIVKNEPQYSLDEAKVFLAKVFKNYDIQIVTDKSDPESVTLNDKTYTFTSNYIVLTAVKN
jgi:ubiquinone/menaquinone biosynthesis C-methylase UbiE